MKYDFKSIERKWQNYWSKNKTFKRDRNSYPVSPGQFGRIIGILKKINVEKFYLLEKLKNQDFLNFA